MSDTKERKPPVRHGHYKSRIYNIWRDMRQRCYNLNANNYGRYGARGIRICDEWRDNFLAFLEWSKESGYSDELSLDRIENNGNYEPSNCKWSTLTEQARNTRKVRENSSGIRGVSLHKKTNTWWAHITANSKTISLGYHPTKEAAAEARRLGELKYWSEVM